MENEKRSDSDSLVPSRQRVPTDRNCSQPDTGAEEMTKKELLAILRTAPDDAVVLTSGSDHSYRRADVTVDSAIQYTKFQFDEDHGDQYIEPGGKRITAIIIS